MKGNQTARRKTGAGTKLPVGNPVHLGVGVAEELGSLVDDVIVHVLMIGQDNGQNKDSQHDGAQPGEIQFVVGRHDVLIDWLYPKGKDFTFI